MYLIRISSIAFLAIMASNTAVTKSKITVAPNPPVSVQSIQATAATSGPTADETIDWLKVQITPYKWDEVSVTSNQLIYIHPAFRGNEVYRYTIPWADVKSLSVVCESICRVTFTGDAEHCVREDEADYKCTLSNSAEVSFYSKVSSQRITNALTRLAVLGGAHLTNNNTF